MQSLVIKWTHYYKEISLMRLFFMTIFAATIAAASSISAQVYPEPSSTTVNDIADMLSPEAEARISETFSDLEREAGAEATIMTLSSVRFYANDMSVADYATGLFNAWGVGDQDKGDGVLLIVFGDDSQLRLTTGTGYDAEAKERAAQIVSEFIIPEFQNDAFEAGLEKGATAIADDLVRNVNAQSTTPAGQGSSMGYGGFSAGLAQ
jgi:uncharacterized protein